MVEGIKKLGYILGFILGLIILGVSYCEAVAYNFEKSLHSETAVAVPEKAEVIQTKTKNLISKPLTITETKTEPEYLISVTDEEIDLMARVVMSEASVLDQSAKDAVAQVIVNRARSDYKEFKYQETVTDVIEAPNQFYTGDNGEPTDECYEAVYRALTMEQYPPDMLWFRKYTVKYGYCYAIFGTGNRTTYFSTVTDYEALFE